MQKIVFVLYGESTFIKQDFNILQKHFKVVPVRFDCLAKVYDIYKAVKHTDICFCWFADVWSFITVVSAKLFKKKSVVVVGGYDVECIKEIKYGMCTKSFWRRWMRTFTLRHATKLLAVSEYTAQKTHPFVYKDAHKLKVVHNGVDTNYFIPKGKKENIVLIVVSGDNNDLISLKGLDKFVQLAKYVHDTTFVVIGLNKKDQYKLRKMYSSNNVKLLERLSQQELLQWYQRSKVYCQLSKIESFGVSLAEAMACRCVPVYMDVGALHEVVGTTGFVMLNDMLNDEQEVKQTKQEQRARWIKKAMDYNINTSLGYLARNRIQQNFSIEKRERELIKIIEEI